MKDQNSIQDPVVKSESYREILTKYNTNNQLLLRTGFNQLKNDLGFTQIRFYCFKKRVGRVLHIMTSNNSTGADVVKFFTNSNSIPRACGSFTRLADDNSRLAGNCGDWGYPAKTNKWGHTSYFTQDRLFKRPILIASSRYYSYAAGKPYSCDDNTKDVAMSLGDLWQIFVR